MRQIPLHNPRREHQLLDIEEHIECCANVSRAAWLLLTLSEGDMCDRRNLQAIRQLVDITADHASAARYKMSKYDGGEDGGCGAR